MGVQVDTSGWGDDDTYLNLFYPRNEGNPSGVVITLYDVRAAGEIRVSFDFENNCWKIEQALYHRVPVDSDEPVTTWHHAANIPAFHPLQDDEDTHERILDITHGEIMRTEADYSKMTKPQLLEVIERQGDAIVAIQDTLRLTRDNPTTD